MRLRDMLKLLEEAKYLEPDFEQVPKTNPPTFLLRNRDELLRILDRVGQVPSLKKATEKAHTEAIPLHFLSHGQRDITHTLSVVKIEAAQLAKAIAAILPPEDPLSLAIRIPKPESTMGGYTLPVQRLGNVAVTRAPIRMPARSSSMAPSPKAERSTVGAARHQRLEPECLSRSV